MYVCTYCGRHLKKKYDNCPACGAVELEHIQNIGEEIIRTPPDGGYKVNLKNYKHERKNHRPYTIIRIYNSCHCISVRYYFYL